MNIFKRHFEYICTGFLLCLLFSCQSDKNAHLYKKWTMHQVENKAMKKEIDLMNAYVDSIRHV
ncbi:MAG: hypothetical protein R2831_09235 [Chitinophagaceae bacterium]